MKSAGVISLIIAYYFIIAMFFGALTLITGCGPVIHVNQSSVVDGKLLLDQQGAVYMLDEDVTANVEFKADSVTLMSTGGYKVLFSEGVGVLVDWGNVDYATIANVEVVQLGDSAETACVVVRGSIKPRIIQVASISRGSDSKAIELDGCTDPEIIRCTVRDSVKVISNRHQGQASIDVKSLRGTALIVDNKVYGSPQWGIRVGSRDEDVSGQIKGNFVSHNSVVTNGYGIGIHADNLEVFDNTVVAQNGRGLHLEGVSGCKVSDNLVNVKEYPISGEYWRSAAHGIKLEGCTDCEIYGNDVTSYGELIKLGGVYRLSMGSALNITTAEGSNNYIHDNTFRAIQLTEPETWAHFSAAFEIANDGAGTRLENNTFITNNRFIELTNWHKPPSGLDICGNTWVRLDSEWESVDLYISNCAVEGLIFRDNRGDLDLSDFGTGWPWDYCSWGDGVETYESGGR